LWFFTVVILFVALGILRSVLRYQNSVELNQKALTFHLIAFGMLAVEALVLALAELIAAL
jgi:membrane protein CcdC involved in cytochrome C biogenesis